MRAEAPNFSNISITVWPVPSRHLPLVAPILLGLALHRPCCRVLDLEPVIDAAAASAPRRPARFYRTLTKTDLSVRRPGARASRLSKSPADSPNTTEPPGLYPFPSDPTDTHVAPHFKPPLTAPNYSRDRDGGVQGGCTALGPRRAKLRTSCAALGLLCSVPKSFKADTRSAHAANRYGVISISTRSPGTIWICA
jgi:hypothetical protein